MQETVYQKSRGHQISTSRSITGHSRTWIHTHHTGNSTSLHSSYAAYTDSHRRACYSDCQSTATTKAFISVSTANFLRSCGWSTDWDFQTDDFQPTFSCSFTTGGKSAQHFWIIQSLCSNSQCASVSADGHTIAIFTLSTSTNTITSAIFHSSWTVMTSQPVQPAESAQISGLARTSRTNQALLRATWIFQRQLFSCLSMPKNKKEHRPTLTLPHSTRKKLCEWRSEG